VSLFRNTVHRELWVEHNCGPCYFSQHDCKILARALRSDRKPVEWKRNPRRNAMMTETIKCTVRTLRPPDPRAAKMFDDVPMFDVTPAPVMDPDHA
jgi:hypothetical protein